MTGVFRTVAAVALTLIVGAAANADGSGGDERGELLTLNPGTALVNPIGGGGETFLMDVAQCDACADGTCKRVRTVTADAVPADDLANAADAVPTTNANDELTVTDGRGSQPTLTQRLRGRRGRERGSVGLFQRLRERLRAIRAR